MGNFLAMFSKANEAAADVDSAKDTASMFQLPCCSSVAGPMLFRIFFYILVLVACGSFVMGVIPAYTRWKGNIVTVEETVLESMDYPDFYFCHPPSQTWELNECYGGTVLRSNMYSGIGEYDPDSSGSCELVLIDDTYRMQRGCAGNTTGQGTGDANLEALRNARKVSLTNQTCDLENGQKRTNNEATTSPNCAVFKIKDDVRASKLGEPRYIVWSGKLKKSDSGNSDYTKCYNPVEVYYTKKGESPVKDNKIVAPFSLIPTCDHLLVADISMRQIKDKTKGDKDYVNEYRQSTFIVNNVDDPLEANRERENMMVFRITDFHVEKVTIRDHEFSDIWTELGGLWAASLILLSLFFRSSGHVDKKGHKLQIFQFLPDSKRNQYLKAATNKESSEVPL